MLWFDFFPVFLGPFVGSFLFAAAVRYPQMTGFVTGRSMCPSCRAQIAIRDLLPVFGWLLLGGRCRVCATPIGWQYPAVELAATAIALWAVAEFSGWLLWVSCALGWVLMALSIIDWRCSRLPDALTLPLLLLGLAVAAVNWPTELADHVFGAVVGYSGLAAIAWAYRRLRGFDGLGLGDAKLLAAGGAWLSWQAAHGTAGRIERK